MSSDATRSTRSSAVVLGLLAFAVVLLTISLGNWQTRRAEQKEVRQRLLDERRNGTVVDLSAGSTDATSLEWRQVRATGEFDAGRTVLVDNRVHQGRPGYHVVTPLRLAGTDTYVLVNRGWLPLGPSRADLPKVPEVTGPVTIEGQAVIPAEHVFELKETAPEFRAGQTTVVQNLLLDRYRKAAQIALLPIVVQQTAGTPDDGLVREWPLPGVGVETHRMYALQWYSFAALAVVLYVVFLYRRRARRSSP